MKTRLKQMVAESQNNIVENNTQTENVVDNAKSEIVVDSKPSVNSTKKPLTPYQKYKNSRNQNGKKYFEFYDDIKVYTHNIYDW